MSLSQIEKNLLVFLDPAGRYAESRWNFVTMEGGRKEAARIPEETAQRGVLCFSRVNLVGYLFCSLILRLKYGKARVRGVLYLNDWLLGCFFYADATDGYHAFVRRHIIGTQRLFRRLVMLLPPVWRAEQRFLVVVHPDVSAVEGPANPLDSYDFMFFSNAAGKLILTHGTTFDVGKGTILKTAASPEYAANLEREQRIVQNIMAVSGSPRLIPSVSERLQVNGRFFYEEEYLCGENLRGILLEVGRRNSFGDAGSLLDRLDCWYTEYRAAFVSGKRPVSDLYAPVLAAFLPCYAQTPGTPCLMECAAKALAVLDRDHAGLVTVVAHNDLWPENFIMQGDQLIAVDWERATEQSSPIFDYYWMIISAVLEYRVGSNGIHDYAIALRQFLDRHDEVCCRARELLEKYIESLGFDRDRYDTFMLLFLMELSIQGYRTFGHVTDNDRMALEELQRLYGSFSDALNCFSGRLYDISSFDN